MRTDPLVEQQARAMGLGTKAEQAFRLPDDAPAPPPIPALGTEAEAASAGSPFDAWMMLLFGS
jgi:hypothetical protein